MFKHKKEPDASISKININYVVGLGKCLGVKVNKDIFTDSNMKSREMIAQLKERLAHYVIKRIAQDN